MREIEGEPGKQAGRQASRREDLTTPEVFKESGS